MYAKICELEILSTFITDVSVGDMLAVEALVANPLDWHHFYEKISTISKGDKTDFTIVTDQGERIVGSGDVNDVEKWSYNSKFGFKIKIKIRRQKSLGDRRLRKRDTGEQKVLTKLDSQY